MEPPNNGQIGSGHFVLYMEVVLFQKRRQTRPIIQGLSVSELVYTQCYVGNDVIMFIYIIMHMHGNNRRESEQESWMDGPKAYVDKMKEMTDTMISSGLIYF